VLLEGQFNAFKDQVVNLASRPELQRALAICRRRKAKLVIPKLDRLSRNLAFTATLMDSSVEFIACDNPHATRLTQHILASVAEHEREMIGSRTSAALQEAKARVSNLAATVRNDWPRHTRSSCRASASACTNARSVQTPKPVSTADQCAANRARRTDCEWGPLARADGDPIDGSRWLLRNKTFSEFLARKTPTGGQTT
jgi:hypothetical protein